MDNDVCAKGIINENNTCFNIDELKSLCYEYNKYMLKHNIKNYISQDIIDSNDSLKILNELKEKLDCKNDLCIIKKKFVEKIKNKKILYQKFKPEGPLKNEWLSNWDIDQNMLRFQNYYHSLLYTGTVSIDFDQSKMFHIYNNVFNDKSNYNLSCFYYFTNECTYNINNKINCIATIYNTSKRSEPGQHWIATFVKKMPNNEIKMYFFDSVGIKPPREINRFFKILEKKLFYNNKIDKQYNYLQHQYKNSECGVYCIDFIDYITENPNAFKEYITKKTKDDVIQKKRKNYFRPIVS